MIRIAALLAAVSMLLAMYVVQPATAQDDIFRPSEQPSQEEPPEPPKPNKPDKPAPDNSSSLAGLWNADSSGHSMCGSNMTVTLRKDLTGTGNNKGYIGTITGTRNGNAIALSISYTDVFGNPQQEVWQGTVAADSRTISGTIVGSWANGCKFVMRKQ